MAYERWPQMLNHIIIIAFALFLFSGAYFGFKAGSKISLIMGLVTGALILVGDVIFRFNPRGGLLFLMIVGGLLVVVFLQRFLQTHKMMPSGMLMIVSILFFSYILYKFLKP